MKKHFDEAIFSTLLSRIRGTNPRLRSSSVIKFALIRMRLDGYYTPSGYEYSPYRDANGRFAGNNTLLFNIVGPRRISDIDAYGNETSFPRALLVLKPYGEILLVD